MQHDFATHMGAPLGISVSTPFVRQQVRSLIQPACCHFNIKVPCAYAHIFNYMSVSSNGVQGDIHAAHKAFECCLSVIHKGFDELIGGALPLRLYEARIEETPH